MRGLSMCYHPEPVGFEHISSGYPSSTQHGAVVCLHRLRVCCCFSCHCVPGRLSGPTYKPPSPASPSPPHQKLQWRHPGISRQPGRSSCWVAGDAAACTSLTSMTGMPAMTLLGSSRADELTVSLAPITTTTSYLSMCSFTCRRQQTACTASHTAHSV